MDEIHRTPKTVEEFLYPAMEDLPWIWLTKGNPAKKATVFQASKRVLPLVGVPTNKGSGAHYPGPIWRDQGSEIFQEALDFLPMRTDLVKIGQTARQSFLTIEINDHGRKRAFKALKGHTQGCEQAPFKRSPGIMPQVRADGKGLQKSTVAGRLKA